MQPEDRGGRCRDNAVLNGMQLDEVYIRRAKQRDFTREEAPCCRSSSNASRQYGKDSLCLLHLLRQYTANAGSSGLWLETEATPGAFLAESRRCGAAAGA